MVVVGDTGVLDTTSHPEDAGLKIKIFNRLVLNIFVFQIEVTLRMSAGSRSKGRWVLNTRGEGACRILSFGGGKK